MTNSTGCNRNCFNKSENLNYGSINCYLQKIRQKNKLPLYVVVMTKNNNGTYSYHQKNISYFIPINNNNNILYAYFTASSHEYNYMYLLSKQYSHNVFEGNHFTIGLKEGKVDLHYTYYTYRSPIPHHRYYKAHNKKPTVIVNEVCDKKITTETDEENVYRCNFFGTVMKYLHDNDNSCQEGGKKFQVGGDDNDVTPILFDKIEPEQKQTLEFLKDMFNTYNEIKAIETFILNSESKIGLLTFCYIKKENGDENDIYVSFPFDYKTKSFIHINKLVETLSSNENVNSNITTSITLNDACLKYYISIEKMFENITNFLNKNINNTNAIMNCNDISIRQPYKFPITAKGGGRKKKNKC